MKASPCLNLDCRALNWRNDGDPSPERCPKCGGPVMNVGRKTPNVEVADARIEWNTDATRFYGPAVNP